jgi:glutaredoxin
MRTLVLYTANGCHLCEEARATLADLHRNNEFNLDIVDISGDPELERLYRLELPVLMLDGRKIAKFRIDPDKVIRALAQ